MSARKTHILWDHDGVLVDTEPWYFEATRSCLAELGVELSRSRYLALMARGVSAWTLATHAEPAELDHWRGERNRRYQAFLGSEDITIDGVHEVLETLAGGYSMAIVTTAKPEDFELIHRSTQIPSFMDFVLMKGDYPRSKPAPDPYLAALERFGVPAANCVVIEDSQRGLAAAVAAGVDCVVVHSPFVAGQDLSAATYRIESLAELPALLAAMQR